jgi:bifunctional ADP-heptose synthase (sugar kinase/adenylyltransferase)
MDPNNTHGRTGVTTWAGDYFFGFYKNYSDQSAIKMNLEVYGANDGFNITVLDDYNSGGGNQYTAKPIRLKGEQIELYVDDTGTPFGNFTLALKVKAARSEFFNQVKLSNESSDPSGENGAMYYNTTTNKFRGFQNGAWINLDGT